MGVVVGALFALFVLLLLSHGFLVALFRARTYATVNVVAGVVVDFDADSANAAFRLGSFVRLLRLACAVTEERGGKPFTGKVSYCRDDRGSCFFIPGNADLVVCPVMRVGVEPRPGLFWGADFGFDRFINDFVEETDQIERAGRSEPTEMRAVFLGSFRQSSNRRVLAKVAERYEGLLHVRDVKHGSKDFQTMTQQAARFAAFVDPLAYGYSGRLKRLLWSRRPVLVVRPRYDEHWFRHLVPGFHFEIVQEDLSDLVEKTRALLQDPAKARLMGERALDFARRQLTRGAEVERLAGALAGTRRSRQ
jgi:hypothetical protein